MPFTMNAAIAASRSELARQYGRRVHRPPTSKWSMLTWRAIVRLMFAPFRGERRPAERDGCEARPSNTSPISGAMMFRSLKSTPRDTVLKEYVVSPRRTRRRPRHKGLQTGAACLGNSTAAADDAGAISFLQRETSFEAPQLSCRRASCAFPRVFLAQFTDRRSPAENGISAHRYEHNRRSTASEESCPSSSASVLASFSTVPCP